MNATTSPETTAIAHLDNRALTGRDLILHADNLNAMIRVSDLMAGSGQAVPRHLRKNPGACFAVTSQAMRWNMEPFALAQKTYTTDDTSPLSYEGQAIIAALNNSPLLVNRLQFEWGGPWEKIIGRFVWKESTKKADDNGKPKKYLAKAWDDNEEQGLYCTVTATLVGEREPRVLQLFLMQARVRNSPLWVEDPRQQLAYLAGRRWGRLHAPDVIMGVYTPDELAEVSPEKFMGPADVVGAPPPPPAPPATYPAAEFDKNLQAWAKAVGTNKKTRDELLAMVQTKGALTEDQLQRLDAAIEKAKPIDASTTGEVVMTYAQVADRLNKADDADKLAVAGSLIQTVADEAQRKELAELYDRRADELNPA